MPFLRALRGGCRTPFLTITRLTSCCLSVAAGWWYCGCLWDSSGNCEKEVKIVSWLGFFGLVICWFVHFTLLPLYLGQRLNEEVSLFSFLIFELARRSESYAFAELLFVLGQKMDYFHRVHFQRNLRDSSPEWVIKSSEKRQHSLSKGSYRH